MAVYRNIGSRFDAGRADIIREELRMSDEEASEFWLVYEKYDAELLVVRDRQAELFAELLGCYRAGSVTNEYAEVDAQLALFVPLIEAM